MTGYHWSAVGFTKHKAMARFLRPQSTCCSTMPAFCLRRRSPTGLPQAATVATMTPRHPAVVHFPIALAMLSVVADAIAWLARDSAIAPSLFAAGWWALVGAVVFGAIAVVLGLSDMRHEMIEHDAHLRVHHHMRIGFAVLGALGALFVWRLVGVLGGTLAVGLGYLVAAVIVLALVIYQGWLGGELVFRYGVGVAHTRQGWHPEPSASEHSHADHE